MSDWNPQLWRTALRLRERRDTLRDGERPAHLPESTWRDVQDLQRRLQLAQEHNWRAAAGRERATLTGELERLASQINDLARTLRRERPAIPPVRLLYEELLAVADEFGAIDLTPDTIGITTAPITLEEIELGRFSVQLPLRRLGEDVPYRVVALDPNPAASSLETTHPHVNGGQLCAGDGRPAIAAALAEGRLFDFFTLVDRVLHTYAEGRAFVELDRWHGVPCYDCDATVGEDERYVCDACDRTVCSDCVGSCGDCSNSFCNGCLSCCERCEASSCRNCLTRCQRCERPVCESCRDGGLCETCLEELEDENEEENAECESDSAEAEPTIHADGLGETPLPA